MIKRITVLSLCLGLMVFGSTKVFANEFIGEELVQDYLEVNPYMNYISRASCSLNINSNGRATIDSSIYGYQGITTKVSITANLQQYKGGKWVNIKTFTENSNSHRTTLTGTVNVAKGYTYRVSGQVKGYSGSSVETRNLMSSQVKY